MGREGQGSPRGQHLKPTAPLRAPQTSPLPIGHAEYLIDIHNHLLLLTLDSTHPPLQTNTATHPGLIEIQKPVSTPQAWTATDGRGGGSVVARWGPINDRCEITYPPLN